jgi:glutamate N-acetyltransferase/amino-acid N-acetyltransferase
VGSVCRRLAQAMARDGEGATKFIEVRVEGAASDEDARRVARAIVGSNLTKAAVLGADPNWGRIACAAGYAGAEFDPARFDIAIGRVLVVRAGLATDYDPAAASAEMRGKEVRLAVHLHLGDGAATAWGCDLTPEYVRLNSEYTT